MWVTCQPNSVLDTIKPELFVDIVKDINVDALPEDALTRLAELKAILDERKQNFGILYYLPQAHQDPFHRSMKKVRMVLGGNQSGKTHAACAEGIAISLGVHPYWSKKIPVPNRGRVIATDLDKGIGEVIGKKYAELVPMSEVLRIRTYPGGQYKKIYWKNGSTTEFLSYEQDTKLMEGWTGHWVQFDEPPPQDKYIACYRGLMRYGGILWIAATPLNEPWIYDSIYLQAGPDPTKPDVFNFDIRDNKYLSEEEIVSFEGTLPDDEKAARMHGKFRHLSGLVYKGFDQVHKIKSFPIPKHWTRYCAMDYHPRVPCAMTWIAIDPAGTAYVYDELWVDKTISEIAQAIKAKEIENGKPRMRWIDPLSAMKDRISGECPQREFAKEGLKIKHQIFFRGATKEWVLGKNAVEEYLKVKNGKPGIYFFEDKVPRNIECLLHYLWDEFTGVANGPKEKPQKKYAHFPDTVRYILVHKPTYIKEVPSQFRSQPTEGHRYTGYGMAGE